MRIKPGIIWKDTDPRLWLYLGAVARIHRKWTGDGLVITSLWRPPGPRPSRHSPPEGQLVTAADVRRWALDDHHKAADFARGLQQEYGAELGVVLEPEWLTPEQIMERGGVTMVAPHLHLELKVDAFPVLL